MKRIIQRVAALVIGLGLGFGALAGLETVTHISDLNSSWPLGSDLASTSDDHIRNIKVALKTDFPNINAAVTGTPTQLNTLTGMLSSSSLILSSGTVTAQSFIPTGSSVPANGIYLPSANTVGFATASTGRGTINSTGTWTVNSPVSGSSLTVNALDGVSAITFQGGTPTNGFRLAFTDSSATRGFLGYGATTVAGAALTDFALAPATAGSVIVGTAAGAAIGTRFGPNGNVTVSTPSSGSSLTLSAGVAGAEVEVINGNATAGQSFGIRLNAGTNSSDYGFLLRNAGNSTSYFEVRGDGAILGGGTVAAGLVDMSPDTGTFTSTYTGFTAGVTCTSTWSRIGKLVMLMLCAATGTSNATSFTMTGLPSAIQPASLTQTSAVGLGSMLDNGAALNTPLSAKVTAASGTITFFNGGGASSFTSSGTKGFSSFGATFSYLLN